MIIQPIVEGYGEVAAVPVLLRRFIRRRLRGDQRRKGDLRVPSSAPLSRPNGPTSLQPDAEHPERLSTK
jgi:hypothetical protein